MSTTRLDIKEAEIRLPAYIDRLKAGDKIILCRQNHPVAEIRPLTGREDQPRPIGLGAGLAEIPESFFSPFPDEILDLFEGQSGEMPERL